MKKALKWMIVLMLVSGALFAQGDKEATVDYPRKPITMIVPFAAGGGTDLVGRYIAEVSSKYLGQSVVVENITGGAGLIGAAEAVKAKPDGYTIFMGTIGLVSQDEMGTAPKGVNWEAFRPIYMFNTDPSCIAVSVNSRFKNFAEMEKYAKENPETVTIGNAGIGGAFHLAAMSIELERGFKFLHTPFAGGTNEAVIATMGNHIDGVICSPAEVDAQVKAGTLRILAVTTEERMAEYPDVPTFREYGIGVGLGTWRGIMVPKTTPDYICEILEDTMEKVGKDEQFISLMAKGKFGLDLRNAKGFYEMMVEQKEVFRNVAIALGVK